MLQYILGLGLFVPCLGKPIRTGGAMYKVEVRYHTQGWYNLRYSQHRGYCPCSLLLFDACTAAVPSRCALAIVRLPYGRVRSAADDLHERRLGELLPDPLVDQVCGLDRQLHLDVVPEWSTAAEARGASCRAFVWWTDSVQRAAAACITAGGAVRRSRML